MEKNNKEVSQTKLRQICTLIDEDKCEEAKRLIPDCRLPLVITHYFVLFGSDISNCPLLHFAIIRDSCDMIEYLLDRGANIELRGMDGHTPLLTAANYGKEECCELLLNRGANIEARSNEGWTPLLVASHRKDETMCRLFLRKKANINAQDENGYTSLHHGIYRYNTPIVKLLLSEGARLEKDRDGRTPLDYADRVDQYTVSLLENHIVTTNLSGVIARGLTDGFAFSDFLVKGICDARLFLIVTSFAYH